MDLWPMRTMVRSCVNESIVSITFTLENDKQNITCPLYETTKLRVLKEKHLHQYILTLSIFIDLPVYSHVYCVLCICYDDKLYLCNKMLDSLFC